MEYWLAERQLRGEGPVRAVYLLHGQETFLHARFLQLLHERLFADDAAVAELNTSELDGAEGGWEAALAAARTVPFLAERRLVVLRQPPGLAGPGQDEPGPALEPFLKDPPATACLAISATSVDRRRRLSKLLEKHAAVVDCAPLKPAELPGWLRRRAGELGGRLQTAAAERLAMGLAPDLHLADQELRKLMVYAGDGEIDEAAVAAVAAQTSETSIWPLLEAVGQRRPQVALRLLQDLLRQGEPPVRVLFMLARQWRQLLQCQALTERGAGQQELAQALGAPPFAVRRLQGQQRQFTRQQLRRGLAQLLDTDVQLKSSPNEPRLLLELCILNLTRP